MFKVLAFAFGWRRNGGIRMFDFKLDLEKHLKDLWFTINPRDMFPTTTVHAYVYKEILERAIAAEYELKLIREVAAEQVVVIDRSKETIAHIAKGNDLHQANIRKLSAQVVKLQEVVGAAKALLLTLNNGVIMPARGNGKTILIKQLYNLQQALAALEGGPPCPK